MKHKTTIKANGLTIKNMNTVLAHAASFMLTGVPPLVCETIINDVVLSVKKSLQQWVS